MDMKMKGKRTMGGERWEARQQRGVCGNGGQGNIGWEREQEKKKANIYIDFCFSLNMDIKQTKFLRFEILLQIATFSLLADQEIQHLRF